jgi:hypothetical protein
MAHDDVCYHTIVQDRAGLQVLDCASSLDGVHVIGAPESEGAQRVPL